MAPTKRSASRPPKPAGSPQQGRTANPAASRRKRKLVSNEAARLCNLQRAEHDQLSPFTAARLQSRTARETYGIPTPTPSPKGPSFWLGQIRPNLLTTSGQSLDDKAQLLIKEFPSIAVDDNRYAALRWQYDVENLLSEAEHSYISNEIVLMLESLLQDFEQVTFSVDEFRNAIALLKDEHFPGPLDMASLDRWYTPIAHVLDFSRDYARRSGFESVWADVNSVVEMRFFDLLETLPMQAAPTASLSWLPGGGRSIRSTDILIVIEAIAAYYRRWASPTAKHRPDNVINDLAVIQHRMNAFLTHCAAQKRDLIDLCGGRQGYVMSYLYFCRKFALNRGPVVWRSLWVECRDMELVIARGIWPTEERFSHVAHALKTLASAEHEDAIPTDTWDSYVPRLADPEKIEGATHDLSTRYTTYQNEVYRMDEAATLWLLIWRALRALYLLDHEHLQVPPTPYHVTQDDFDMEESFLEAFQPLFAHISTGSEPAFPREIEDVVHEYCKHVSKCSELKEHHHAHLPETLPKPVTPEELAQLPYLSEWKATHHLLLQQATRQLLEVTGGRSLLRRDLAKTEDIFIWSVSVTDLESDGEEHPAESAPAPSRGNTLAHAPELPIDGFATAEPRLQQTAIVSAFEQANYPFPETNAQRIAASRQIAREMRDAGVQSDGARVEDLINLPPHHIRMPMHDTSPTSRYSGAGRPTSIGQRVRSVLSPVFAGVQRRLDFAGTARASSSSSRRAARPLARPVLAQRTTGLVLSSDAQEAGPDGGSHGSNRSNGHAANHSDGRSSQGGSRNARSRPAADDAASGSAANGSGRSQRESDEGSSNHSQDHAPASKSENSSSSSSDAHSSHDSARSRPLAHDAEHTSYIPQSAQAATAALGLLDQDGNLDETELSSNFDDGEPDENQENNDFDIRNSLGPSGQYETAIDPSTSAPSAAGLNNGEDFVIYESPVPRSHSSSGRRSHRDSTLSPSFTQRTQSTEREAQHPIAASSHASRESNAENQAPTRGIPGALQDLPLPLDPDEPVETIEAVIVGPCHPCPMFPGQFHHSCRNCPPRRSPSRHSTHGSDPADINVADASPNYEPSWSPLPDYERPSSSHAASPLLARGRPDRRQLSRERVLPLYFAAARARAAALRRHLPRGSAPAEPTDYVAEQGRREELTGRVIPRTRTARGVEAANSAEPNLPTQPPRRHRGSPLHRRVTRASAARSPKDDNTEASSKSDFTSDDEPSATDLAPGTHPFGLTKSNRAVPALFDRQSPNAAGPRPSASLAANASGASSERSGPPSPGPRKANQTPPTQTEYEMMFGDELWKECFNRGFAYGSITRPDPKDTSAAALAARATTDPDGVAAELVQNPRKRVLADKAALVQHLLDQDRLGNFGNGASCYRSRMLKKNGTDPGERARRSKEERARNEIPSAAPPSPKREAHKLRGGKEI